MPDVKKLSIGLAPLAALALIAAWSTCRVVGAGAGVPGDAAWARAAAVVRERHQPGQLIVFAPRWVDPVGRLHLGDLIPLEMAGERIGGPQELPRPGRDARAVLAALGYDDDRIEALIGSGAVEEST